MVDRNEANWLRRAAAISLNRKVEGGWGNKMKKAVEQDTLVVLIESEAAREFRASREPGSEGWSLSVRFGCLGCWRSRCEPDMHLGE